MKQKFYNVDIDIINEDTYFSCIKEYFEDSKLHIVGFLNAHCFNVAQKDEEYRKTVNSFDLLLNDGIGIKLGCLLNGYKPMQNMNGTDLIPRTVEFAQKYNKKIYLLGGEEGIALNAKRKLLSLYPGVNVCGVHSGFFSKEEESVILNEIEQKKTDILIIGMGVPKQELWIQKKKTQFAGLSLILPGGAILDFLAGKVKRAPVFIQKLGLEWVIRLIQEPRRLAKRYLLGNIIFLATIITYKIFPSAYKN